MPPTGTVIPSANEVAESTASLATNTAAMLQNTAANDAAAISMSHLSGVGGAVQGIFESISTKLASVSQSLSNTTGLTTNQVAAFSALANATIGVRESFKGTFDSAPLNTFSGQLKEVFEVFDSQRQGAGALAKLFQDTFGKALPDSIKNQGVPAIKSFIMSMSESADNALRLQNALFKMGAVTGGLGKVLRDAGSEFQNMNDILMSHQKMVTFSI